MQAGKSRLHIMYHLTVQAKAIMVKFPAFSQQVKFEIKEGSKLLSK